MPAIKNGFVKDRIFLTGIVSLVLFYFFFELFFNRYSIITVDEFWFAHRIYEYKDKLPYRDFSPYKTVLGYYLWLPSMLVYKDVLPTLISMKNTIALFNACLLLGCSYWLKRFFSQAAILTSLALLIFSETLLIYSTQIRVDLLAYWFALIALLFLLENRYRLAGLCMGLGFITSQKCLWYLFAANIALLLHGYFFARNMQTLKHILWFNISTGLIILSYLLFWSWISSWDIVYNSVFKEAAIMYHLDSYEAARMIFWKIILLYNPILFLLWPAIACSLYFPYSSDTAYQKRFFIFILACTIMACLIPFKQPFPYYMQVTFPIFLLLYAAYFHWIYASFTDRIHCLINKWQLNYIYLSYAFYFIFIFTLIFLFKLPLPYLFISLIPFALLMNYFPSEKYQWPHAKAMLSFILSMLFIVGGLYPFTLLIKKLYSVDGTYQKKTLIMLQSLLDNQSDYLAGIELLYNKTQPIAGLRHLGVTALDYLHHPSAALHPAMLASLYATPSVTSASAITALKQSHVKLYVNNYRMERLPQNIKDYLTTHYAHYWGSIYLYAPSVAAGKNAISLPFSGKYEIQTTTHRAIQLDGHVYQHQDQVYLAAGNHFSVSHTTYRLKFVPAIKIPLQKLDDHWEQMLI